MHYGLIIIGAGPGGYEMAVEAAHAGLKVAIAERDLIGGTCLNRGCIPTKTLCRNAEVVALLHNAAHWGVTTGGETHIDFAAMMRRKEEVVTTLRNGVEQLLSQPNITLLHGEARLTDAHTIAIADDSHTADHIVIATGSAPRSLPIEGAHLAISSDEALSLTSIPSSLCIIGGGVIGMEFAAIFSALGCEVTVVEFCKEILPPFDKDVAKRLRTLLGRRGVKIVVQAAVQAIEAAPDGHRSVVYQQKGRSMQIESEMVLMAVGRKAVIPQGTEPLGVVTERGFITVDNHLRTSVKGVYAIGDVNGRCMLAHAATAQGRVALAHIMGKESAIDLAVVPSAVFTTPELAMVGFTEQQCIDAAVEYKVGKAMFAGNGKALAMGEPDGLVKLLATPDGSRILGCHICGAHAADLVQEVATAMSASLPVNAIVNAIHGHPTLSEAVAEAARNALR